jgi:hypothetical protein
VLGKVQHQIAERDLPRSSGGSVRANIVTGLKTWSDATPPAGLPASPGN